ncbi:MAG: hypothetical protein IJ243_08125, partial [Prevotella sp.]|nr:hypothetical protein [Prevotella sp.]
IPNRFVDSINHNSIIVQIPSLHGKVNNRLDKVLSIFDQSTVCTDNQHYLNLDEKAFDLADADMQPIFHRLLMAASNIEMRQNMNVEDEYYSIIKEQEGKVYGLERDLAEKIGEIAEKDTQLAEKNTQLAEKNTQLAEKDGQLAEKNTQLAEKDGQLAEKDGQLAKKDTQLAEKDGQLAILVKMLLQSGQTVDAIAENLHIDKESIMAFKK